MTFLHFGGRLSVVPVRALAPAWDIWDYVGFLQVALEHGSVCPGARLRFPGSALHIAREHDLVGLEHNVALS